jgi:type I restriction enzyme S subunit
MVKAMEIPRGFKKTEVGIIPSDWNDFDITQLIEKANGIKIGPFGSQLKKELLTNAGFRVYGQENVYEKDMEIGNRFISREHFKQLNSCELKTGDFIISMMGTIGKCMIVPAKFEAGIMDSHLIRLRLDDSKINAELLLHFFASNILINQIKKLSVGGIMDGLSSKIVKNISVPLPPTRSEQTAIAEALNDADALITELEKLISKKRAIKQGAMQVLLKPKEGWKVKKLGEIGSFKNGINKSSNDFGFGSPFVNLMDVFGKTRISSNKHLGLINSNDAERKLYNLKEGDVVFIRSSVKPDGVGLTCVIKNNLKDTVFSGFIIRFRDYDFLTTEFKEYCFYTTAFRSKLLSNSTVSANTNINQEALKNLTISFPLSKSEQTRIAQILSDMDAEIAALEKKLNKYKMLMQGMMQNLLTGKIRLSSKREFDSQTKIIQLTSKEMLIPKHNWEFNEAVIIATLTHKFSNSKYPLGRKRYTKLSYLLHRHIEVNAEGYLRKAAGPYNPKTKYKGPEQIALKNNYIKNEKSGNFSGFISSDNISKALDYFKRWYGDDVLIWLEQFRKQTNDTLELWTTVDMTMQELKYLGKEISLKSIKEFIYDDKEWKHKLEMPFFSDINIKNAMINSQILFD